MAGTMKLSPNGPRRFSWRRGAPRDAGLRPHFGRFENRAVQGPDYFLAEFLVLRQFRLACHSLALDEADLI